MIKKSGLMEFWPPTDINDVGGLENLKEYVRNRAKAFEPGNEHLPKPKGILLVGLPGTGKSLAAKAIAHILGWPLIRLDIGALKTSLVGASEQRMRDTTRVIDAFGNAVIWLDEVEKAFAGVRSSGESDAGTTANIFSHFLIWMQETTTPMMVVATAVRDQIHKVALYERHGVKEYWLVHPSDRLVTIRRWGSDGRYGMPQIFEAKGTLAVATLPGLAIDLDAVFRRLEPQSPHTTKS